MRYVPQALETIDDDSSVDDEGSCIEKILNQDNSIKKRGVFRLHEGDSSVSDETSRLSQKPFTLSPTQKKIMYAGTQNKNMYELPLLPTQNTNMYDGLPLLPTQKKKMYDRTATQNKNMYEVPTKNKTMYEWPPPPTQKKDKYDGTATQKKNIYNELPPAPKNNMYDGRWNKKQKVYELRVTQKNIMYDGPTTKNNNMYGPPAQKKNLYDGRWTQRNNVSKLLVTQKNQMCIREKNQKTGSPALVPKNDERKKKESEYGWFFFGFIFLDICTYNLNLFSIDHLPNARWNFWNKRWIEKKSKWV